MFIKLFKHRNNKQVFKNNKLTKTSRIQTEAIHFNHFNKRFKSIILILTNLFYYHNSFYVWGLWVFYVYGWLDGGESHIQPVSNFVNRFEWKHTRSFCSFSTTQFGYACLKDSLSATIFCSQLISRSISKFATVISTTLRAVFVATNRCFADVFLPLVMTNSFIFLTEIFTGVGFCNRW